MKKYSVRSVLPLLLSIAWLPLADLRISAQTQLPTFYVVLFKEGPAYDKKKPPLKQDGIKGHVAHFKELGDKLVGASPMFGADDSEPIKGMIIMKAADLDEAKRWVASDPLIIAKTNIASVFMWTPVGWNGAH